MPKPTLTPFEAFEPLFDRLWLALGPAQRAEYQPKCEEYHDALRDLRVDSIRHAVEHLRDTTQVKVLPTPGALRQLAVQREAALREASAQAAPAVTAPYDPSKCECGCGGKRWYELLLDAQGKPRRFAADIAVQGVSVAQAERVPGFREALAALAGEPMLRQHLTCARDPRKPIDSARALHLWGTHEDGTPVYAVRPRPAGKAVAA